MMHLDPQVPECSRFLVLRCLPNATTTLLSDLRWLLLSKPRSHLFQHTDNELGSPLRLNKASPFTSTAFTFVVEVDDSVVTDSPVVLFADMAISLINVSYKLNHETTFRILVAK